MVSRVHTANSWLFLIFLLLTTSLTGLGQTKTSGKAFNTPEEAMNALASAATAYDTSALKEIFGPEGESLVSSADPVRDKTNAAEFAAKANEKRSVVLDPKDHNRAIVTVGADGWPLPIPLVKKTGKWYFDSKAGAREVLLRRIGENELDAIQVCRGYVDAQHEYAFQMHDGVNQYAQRIISSPGKRDGLYWVDADGTPGGPISEEIARALAEGYSAEKGPFHGYYFKILKGQGPAAKLGKLDYVIQGVMIGGFALIAVPAEYRVTGVNTFIVNQEGVVYQKDLGPDTLNMAKAIALFNPDKTWRRTDDQWPPDAGDQ